MSMTLSEVKQLVKAEIPAQKRQIYRAINRAIRRINSAFIGYQQTEKPVVIEAIYEALTLTFAASPTNTITYVSGGALSGDFTAMGFAAGQKIWFAGTGALNVTELEILSIGGAGNTVITCVTTDTVIADASIAGTLSGFTVDSGYTWDYVDKELTMPTYARELAEVLENDVKLVPRDLEYISDSDFDDEQVYCPLSDNVLKFPSWLMETEEDYCTVELLRNIDVITTDTDATVIGIRTRMENMFIAAVFFDLYSSPEFKDVDLATINFNDFNKSIEDYNQEEIRRLPTKLRDLKYKY
uniref:Uncharacterized protein n=1 Tax=viral metagenome TaxID=1070528 RepID=A0A6H1ZTH8_9ZZZZ